MVGVRKERGAGAGARKGRSWEGVGVKRAKGRRWKWWE